MRLRLQGVRTALHVQTLREASAHVRAIASDPTLADKLPSGVPSTSEYVRQLLVRKVRARLRMQPLEEPTEFVIAASTDSTFLGKVVLHHIDLPNKRAEVGYWLVEAARGRGVASEAVDLVCSWAFASLGLERMELMTSPDNLAAIAVARRLGFSEEGLLRKRDVQRGERTDMLVFGRLRPGM